jgi:hypothetical protein
MYKVQLSPLPQTDGFVLCTPTEFKQKTQESCRPLRDNIRGSNYTVHTKKNIALRPSYIKQLNTAKKRGGGPMLWQQVHQIAAIKKRFYCPLKGR